MSVTVLIPATTQRLTTLEAVMAEVPLADQLLFAESLIDQASAAVCRECGVVSFAQQAYREVIRADYGGPYLFVTQRPLLSVSSVGSGDTLVLGTDYRVDSLAGGTLYRRRGWYVWPWYGVDAEWTVDYLSGYILPEQVNPPDPTGPTLRGMAADLERATIETIKVWFHERMVGERVESRRLGEQSISYGVQARRTGIPVLAKDLLLPWQQLRMA